MRSKLLAGVVLLILTIGCSKEPEPVIPFEDQLAIDIKKIDDYLADKGIVAQVDESGLRYVIHTEGAGTISPTEDNCLLVSYKGLRLRDDFPFDSSASAKLPFIGVIKGWQIGLEKMQIGDSATLYIPSGLAYGPNGRGVNIGKNEILYFGLKINNYGEYYFNPAAGVFMCGFD